MSEHDASTDAAVRRGIGVSGDDAAPSDDADLDSTGTDRDKQLVISSRALTKRFRSGQVAVDGIDLRIPPGAVYGFLGPNGSGKTTTIRMLLGLVSPTSGSAHVLGETMPDRAPRVLPRVGSLVEGPAFHPYLSGRANLNRLDAADATADPRTRSHRAEQALDRVGLTAAARKPYRQYSLGMKQRLGLAAALLRPRDLYILDEPTNGLDPQGTREVRHLLREVTREGASVLVSSHLLGEIEQVCSHVGIMSRGRLVAQGRREDLAAGSGHTVAVTTTAHCVEGVERILTDLGISEVTQNGLTLRGKLNATLPEQISAAVVNAGNDLVGFAVERASLESLFVELTGEGFDVAR